MAVIVGMDRRMIIFIDGRCTFEECLTFLCECEPHTILKAKDVFTHAVYVRSIGITMAEGAPLPPIITSITEAAGVVLKHCDPSPCGKGVGGGGPSPCGDGGSGGSDGGKGWGGGGNTYGKPSPAGGGTHDGKCGDGGKGCCGGGKSHAYGNSRPRPSPTGDGKGGDGGEGGSGSGGGGGGGNAPPRDGESKFTDAYTFHIMRQYALNISQQENTLLLARHIL